MAQQDISVSTDSIIFCTEKGKTRVLLIQRKKSPYKDRWALPGGFLQTTETLEAGARRELEEETGLKAGELYSLRPFGDPGRDPRGRTISLPFWGVVPAGTKVKGGDDAARASWFDMDTLPDLAFDHDKILQLAHDCFQSENP